MDFLQKSNKKEFFLLTQIPHQGTWQQVVGALRATPFSAVALRTLLGVAHAFGRCTQRPYGKTVITLNGFTLTAESGFNQLLVPAE